MKKLGIFLSLLVFFGNLAFAQKSAESANRNTAIRCYKLAESCMVGKDWQNALNQAELGLSYDASISDLIYIKAIAKINLGENKFEVLNIISEAFEKNNWISYSKNGARILLADLLSDSGMLVQSLEVLDSEPLLFSSDAEIIRIKNYYRIGTENSINQARLKINSSRRVYPSDERFSKIFFLYELMLKKNAYLNEEKSSYESDLLKIIADSYISKLPDYNTNSEFEIMATFFADEEKRSRMIKVLDSKGNSKNPLFVILALLNGYYTQTQAVEQFFYTSDNQINLDLLEILAKNLTEEDSIQKLVNILNEYEGYIYVDSDDDLQDEFKIKYSLGRPLFVTYDSDNDGIDEFNFSCNFGVPEELNYSIPQVKISYETYPKVQKVCFIEENCTFHFLYDDYLYQPIELLPDSYIKQMDFDFYVPAIVEDFAGISFNELSTKTVSVEFPLEERADGKIIYTMLDGKLHYARFFEGNEEYAYCDFESGVPFVRYVDMDFDGYYETTETYDIYTKDSDLIYDDNFLITNVFSKIASNQNLYLKQVKIDRNANNFYEYSEEFLGSNGRSCIWDNDDDGFADVKYTRFPANENEPVNEETVFYGKDGVETVKIALIDDIPIKLFVDAKEVMIFAGEDPNFYWLESEGSAEFEEQILSKVKNKIESGKIDLLDFEESRVMVIKVFKDYFCRIVNEYEEE